MKKNKTVNINYITQAGIMIALATILSFIKVYKLPFGGSVTAGSMIPILIIGLRWGTLPGIITGIVYGIIQSIIDPYVVHPAQYLLDYPIAFGLLGLSGLRKNIKQIGVNNKFMDYLSVIDGIFLGITGRFVSHVIAGVVFFAEFAPEGMNPWLYSMAYNGSYLAFELVISIIIIIFLWKYLKNWIE